MKQEYAPWSQFVSSVRKIKLMGCFSVDVPSVDTLN
jgi:hypothetical protein